jgi:serine/threonine protein kinase
MLIDTLSSGCSPSIPGYAIEQQLLHTSHNIIYRARSLTNSQLVAIKVSNDSLEHEFDIVSGITHESLLKPIDLLPLDSVTNALILPYAEGGDLFDTVANSILSEETAKLIFFRIAQAIKELHSRRIWHQDIKLENILLMKTGDPESAVLADFGFARRFPTGICFDLGPGSPQYTAPEILLQESYTAKVDVWSLGITIFAAITGRFPVGERYILAEIFSGFRGFLRHPGFQTMSSDLKDLLSGMLDREPLRRLTIQEVVEHRWFNPIRWKCIRNLNYSLSGEQEIYEQVRCR